MPGIIVIGTQWGDEGKGKIVDWLTDHAQGVDKRYGPEGFVLNINEPRNLLAHHSDAPSALATLHVEREYQ